MPRIVGVDIPNDKVTWVALQYVHGIGKHAALELLRAGARGEVHQRSFPPWRRASKRAWYSRKIFSIVVSCMPCLRGS